MRLQPARFVLGAVLAFVFTTSAMGQDLKAESAKFNNYYRGTKVWMANKHGDAYNKILSPGAVLTIRVPGIYADVANLAKPMPLTTIENGKVTHAESFIAGGARELKPGETVFLTDIKMKGEILHFEILTAQETALGSVNTRYRGELDFHIPNLQSINTFKALKAIIDPIMTADKVDEPAASQAANASQTKTVDLGMSTDAVKSALGNPDKIINLGLKTIYVYKDIKVIFQNSVVADVQ